MDGLREIQNLRVRWILVYDGQTPKELTAPGPIPPSLEIVPLSWTKGPCRFGINQKNFGMDRMEPGFYHLLDDDNVVHPSFFSRVADLIQKHPEKKAFGFNQRRWDHHGDLPCRADRMFPGKIDNTMFVVATDFIGSKRYDLERAGWEDGWFFHELFRKDEGAWLFPDEWLVYYNYLGHHSGEPGMKTMPTLDVFIVTYRSEAYLPALLADLKIASKVPHNLKVVDNTGNKQTLTALWNDLWRGSSAEYVAFLNPDIKVSPGWDQRLLECLEKRPEVGIALANRYFNSTGHPNLAQMTKVSGEYTNQTKYQDLGEHLEGFYAFMTRRSFLQSVKGFDERFRFYFADSDLQLRALKSFGLKTTQVNYCLIAHIGAVSTQEADRLGEIDRQAEFSYVAETRAKMQSGALRPWHDLTDQERADIRADPAYCRMPTKGQIQKTPEGKPMKNLIIDDIYSPAGRKALIEAYTKSMWSDQVFHRTYWAGLPVLQVPEDLIMIAELVWHVRPKLIVECGIWKGGGLVFYASLLSLLGGEVIGVDVNIAQALEVKRHPLGGRITLIQGSSADQKVVEMIRPKANEGVMVILDSNHTAAHVRAELENFAPLIKPGGYLIALDGVMKILHDAPNGDPAWKNDNPDVAVTEFLAKHPEFERDANCGKFGMTYGPGGFLRRK